MDTQHYSTVRDLKEMLANIPDEHYIYVGNGRDPITAIDKIDAHEHTIKTEYELESVEEMEARLDDCLDDLFAGLKRVFDSVNFDPDSEHDRRELSQLKDEMKSGLSGDLEYIIYGN